MAASTAPPARGARLALRLDTSRATTAPTRATATAKAKAKAKATPTGKSIDRRRIRRCCIATPCSQPLDGDSPKVKPAFPLEPAMQSKHLRLGKGFRPAFALRRVQAAEMVLAPGDSEGGPDNAHRGSDQWLFVVSGTGVAIVEGARRRLRAGS